MLVGQRRGAPLRFVLGRAGRTHRRRHRRPEVVALSTATAVVAGGLETAVLVLEALSTIRFQPESNHRSGMSRATRQFLVAISVAMALALMFFVVNRKHLDSAEAAAWFQAFGALGAIYVTQRIASEQARRSAEERYVERNSFLNAVHHIAAEALNLALTAEQSLRTASGQLGPENFADVGATITAISIERMPSGVVAVAWIRIRRHLEDYGRLYSIAYANVALGEPVPAQIQHLLDRNLRNIRREYALIEEFCTMAVKQMA